MRKKIQLRGNCPICGREHAVVQGRMSKHGYHVKDRWFQGICYGERHEPMQKSRDATEEMVAGVRRECAELRERALGLRAGTIKPQFVIKPTHRHGRGKGEDEMIPFDQAPAYEQRKQVESDAWNAESRAKYGERFADDMIGLLDRVHGTPLREIDLEAARPAPIEINETRLGANGTRKLTVTRVDGACIYWTDERGFKGSTSSAAWRRFPLAS